MCRYGFTPYKDHFACLTCQKSWKYQRYGTYVCPQCSKPLVRMGRDFKAPRKESKKQWDKLRFLVEEKGERLFDSCGCTGPGYMPKTYSEAKRNDNK